MRSEPLVLLDLWQGASRIASWREVLGNSVIWCFIKFYEEERYADDFISGRVYMNTLKYFKDLEDEPGKGRADPTEAIWAWLQPDNAEMTITVPGLDLIKIIASDLAAPISMTYKWHDCLKLFCMYAIHSNTIGEASKNELVEQNQCRIGLNVECKSLGTFAVIISAGPFLERLRRELEKLGYRANGKLVTYYDDNAFNGEIPLGEIPFWKQKRFSYQQEFRICVYPASAEAQPLIIEMGDLSNICKKISSSELPTHLLLTLT